MRLGIFQSACGGLEIEERIERLSISIEAYQEESGFIDLILCPELFVSGYNVGDQLIQLAQPDDGKFYQQIRNLTSKYHCAIVYGYPEQADQKLYNSAACVAADGTLLANHRKRLNSPGSFEEEYFTPGSCATYFDYNGFKIALMICYEVEFPESGRIAASNGAHLVLVPTALLSQWDVVAEKVVPTRAFENGVWLAYANHAGIENGFEYFGGSKIVAPSGEVRVHAGESENLIGATIDINSVKAAQKRLPYLRDYTKL